MTDKQIIIDGVNVSGCEFYNADDETCREENSKYPIDVCEFAKCKGWNCCYKQLKRAENQIVDLNKMVEAKEQECEELKEELKHYKQIAQYHGDLSVKYTNKSAKLKQTLVKIKEIVEKQCVCGVDCIDIKQILQLISEVEE